ncbi:hypothetical protein V438_01130 [Clostridioides difficile]|nr:hypothetical protein HMPREF0220_1469 [Clostridioides difficile NAP08]EFH15407.1 hypothetical protein HMPREF0219_1925 [Clostridioides difficile NAP07]EHJ25781.1 hypothetical protein HMPREF1122_03492 [Clostridioides difficile 002-P50-2011]EHJ26738.1 hypothetical protein HMPREF1123_02874 [Clostridioides difficile 050-P50-2011]EHJ40957.1 hypothetical protein HMPREF9945_00181 [Clostridioides difficile 70-100-2010]EQE30194.1 putative membrane protein [Clostridioides difficile CD34]EQE35018.1 put
MYYRIGGLNMDMDLLFKIVFAIVAIGVSVKIIKTVASLAFKIALILLIILFVYRMFL